MYSNGGSIRQPLMANNSFYWCSSCHSSHHLSSPPINCIINRQIMGLGSMSMSGAISTSRGFEPTTVTSMSPINTISDTSLPLYPPYPVDMRLHTTRCSTPSTSIWSPVFNTTPLTTNTTASSINTPATTTTVTTASQPISGNLASHTSENIWQPCCESKQYFESVVANMESMRKSNEHFQRNVLNELTQLRHVLINLKEAINDLPLKIGDAITMNRSRSVSFDSEIELIDNLSNIALTSNTDSNEICEQLESELNETKRESDSETKTNDGVIDQLESQNGDQVDYAKTESINSNRCVLVNGKVIFEYSSELDMDKWLRKN